MDTITIKVNGTERRVAKVDYVKAKTKQLREFGYNDLKETDVLSNLESVLAGAERKGVIAMMIRDDIVL